MPLHPAGDPTQLDAEDTQLDQHAEPRFTQSVTTGGAPFGTAAVSRSTTGREKSYVVHKTAQSRS